MALSPNYSWAEPDNSSLVKNGAADIRTLGDAIDTSVWNVGFGQASKNKIINGDFRINQRSFTSTTTSATYGFDRWRNTSSGGTVTYSAQTFTAGTAPVAGYEGINYARLVTTGQSASSDRAVLNQLIEDVRTLSGQTATISFWAQAGSGTPKINVVLNQNFGTGGSSSVNAPTPTAQTISTSWARYSFTIAVPSVAGKTISATDSRLNLQIYVSDGGDQATGVTAQNNTFNIWGVQAEYGSKMTPFQTASGSIQGELALCQRYYWRFGVVDSAAFNGSYYATTGFYGVINFPTMRVSPTFAASSADALNIYRSGAVAAGSAVTGSTFTPNSVEINVTTGISVVGDGGWARFKTTGSPYLEFSSEL